MAYCTLPAVQSRWKSAYQMQQLVVLVQRIVPQQVQEIPHAFESVGHIAHLNLRDDLLPYKHIIGQVLSTPTMLADTVLLRLTHASALRKSCCRRPRDIYHSPARQCSAVLQVILDKNPAIKTVVNKVVWTQMLSCTYGSHYHTHVIMTPVSQC